MAKTWIVAIVSGFIALGAFAKGKNFEIPKQAKIDIGLTKVDATEPTTSVGCGTIA